MNISKMNFKKPVAERSIPASSLSTAKSDNKFAPRKKTATTHKRYLSSLCLPWNNMGNITIHNIFREALQIQSLPRPQTNEALGKPK